jgi:hypothetical protein
MTTRVQLFQVLATLAQADAMLAKLRGEIEPNDGSDLGLAIVSVEEAQEHLRKIPRKGKTIPFNWSKGKP